MTDCTLAFRDCVQQDGSGPCADNDVADMVTSHVYARSGTDPGDQSRRWASAASVQAAGATASDAWRIRGSGEKTSSRIDRAMPAQPIAMPPRMPIVPATAAARSAPRG